MEMPLSLLNVSAQDAQVGRLRHLDNINADLERAQGDIASVIEQVEMLRRDLGGGNSEEGFQRRSLLCCCCRRRDLKKLEDRLWARLHLLQEKENELHRQKTAILSRSLTPAGEPPPDVLPPSVSPDAPPSPLWQHHHNTKHTITTTSKATHQRRVSEQQQQQQQQQPFRSEEQQHATFATASSSRPLLADFRHPSLSCSSNPTAPTTYAANLPVAQLLQAAAAAAAATGVQQVPRQPAPPRPRPPSFLRRRPSRPGSAEDTGSGAE